MKMTQSRKEIQRFQGADNIIFLLSSYVVGTSVYFITFVYTYTDIDSFICMCVRMTYLSFNPFPICPEITRGLQS